ncbi:MAG: hypothetical protein GX604_09045 [Actinobacteria bacterium]|nr:hypothetical protein [Actinomycetota bacterium]
MGGLDEHLHYAMDYDLLCRALQYTSVEYVSDTLARFRLHSASKTTSQPVKMDIELVQVAQRYWHLLPQTEQVASRAFCTGFLVRWAGTEALAGRLRAALTCLDASLKVDVAATLKNLGGQFLAGLRRHAVAHNYRGSNDQQNRRNVSG